MLSSLVLFALIAFAAAGQESCGPNEVWTECTGCELKCGEDENKPCTLNCRPPSCFCSPAKGLRRHPDGQCVSTGLCPPQPRL